MPREAGNKDVVSSVHPQRLPINKGQPNDRAGLTASLIVVLICEVLAVGGQLTLETAMNRVGTIAFKDLLSPMALLGRMVGEPRLGAGLLLFGISAVFWMVALSRVPLSLAYPFAAFQHISIVAASWLLLGERVPPLRWLGVCVLGIGLVIVGLSFRNDEDDRLEGGGVSDLV
jgi:drug/metabolite transporter (DMT)-like permease